MARKATKKNNGPIRVELPIEFRIEDAPVVFANQMLVQSDEHEAHFSFFDIKPPLLLGTDEQKQEQLKQIKSVSAKCVVRVVISAGRLEKFANALQDALEKRQAILALTNGKQKK